jgi:hypothetical protein
MCHAILEIRYKAASSQVETIKVMDAEALESRLSALQNNDLVERITIFKPERVLRRQTTWSEE